MPFERHQIRSLLKKLVYISPVKIILKVLSGVFLIKKDIQRQANIPYRKHFKHF